MAVVLLVALAGCSRDPLPEIPYFELLGFEESLPAVRAQVRDVYDRLQAEPLDAELNGRLAMHLSAYRKSAAAEILYRRARALASDEFRWAYYLAFTLMDMGRTDEAIAMFRQALALAPQHPEARIALAGQLLQNDELEQSRRLYESISVELPDRVEGWLGLGKIDLRLGNNEAALASLKRAVAVGGSFGEVHFALGEALRAAGDRDAAAREFEIYERLKDNRVRAADELLLAVGALNAGDAPHMARGRYQLEHAQFEQAAESFRSALAVNPQNQDAWIRLIDALGAVGDIDAAGAVYRDALAGGIAYAPLHIAYGKALLDVRRLDAARPVLTTAIEMDGQSAAAFAALGRVEMLSGANEAAVEHFRRALALRPADRQVQFSLVRVLNRTGAHEDAVAQLQPLLSDPSMDSSLTFKELGLAYHGLGRVDEAIDALEQGRDAAWEAANVRAADAIDELLEQWR
jgi:tetratricopeptide (TPR) repeat protein